MNNYISILPKTADGINNLCYIINDWAEKKGWNEGEDSVIRKSSDIALMHSELSECLEFVRKKTKPSWCPTCDSTETTFTSVGRFWECDCCSQTNGEVIPSDDHVPSLTGEAAELADVLIRIFHYCGRRGINLGEAVRLKHEYNLTRPYKHGKNL